MISIAIAAFILCQPAGGAPAADSLEDYVESGPETIVSGLKFTEGPAWHPDGYLVFSDIPADTIYRWDEEGGLGVLHKPAGSPNGNAFDADGRLVTAEHAGRVTRRVDGKRVTLVERVDGKRLNSPNDMTIHSSGAIYFTDPTYGLGGREREIPYCGVYRLDVSGDVTLLTDTIEMPNGIALSPDERHLYIADTPSSVISICDVQPDGGIADLRPFVDLKAAGLRGGADGLKVDSAGNLYATGPGGVSVVTPDGRIVGRIRIDRTTNVGWGGDDRRTLFVTAGSRVYRVRMKTKGL